MHATAFLSQHNAWTPVPIVVLFGEELHLKGQVLRHVLQQTLGTESAELECRRYAGGEVDLKTVRDELLTVSMFAPRRAVVVEDADEFVTANRSGLEDYFDRPAKSSLLVLAVKTWQKTTRLAKRLPQVGLAVECSELSGVALQRWIAGEVAARGNVQIAREAVSLMIELAGTSLGLLSQEVDKLVAYVGERNRITVEDVRALVGGWRAETTWQMLDAVRDGRPGAALTALDKLLTAGEKPPKLLGGVNYVFRKFAVGTELARGGSVPLRGALKQAGVFDRDLDAAASYLRRIGRPQAERLLSLLAQADSHIKGGSRLPERLLLEQLLLQLSGAVPTT